MGGSLKETQSAVDTAVGDGTTLLDPVAALRSIKDAIDLFHSNPGFQHLRQVVGTVKSLEKENRETNELLQKEKGTLATATSTFEETLTRQRNVHTTKVDDLNAKVEELERTTKHDQQAILDLKKQHVEEIQSGEKKLNAAIQSLQNENNKIKDSERKSKKLYEESQHMLKQKDETIKKLRDDLKRSQNERKGLTEELTLSKATIKDLENFQQTLQQDYDALEDDCKVCETRLGVVESFSVKLQLRDTDKLKNDLVGWWSSLTTLVRETFNKNLSEDTLSGNWSMLRNNKIFDHRIPLPQSNSPVAKEMRIVVVLGAIARLVDEFVLQPAYLFQDREDFRNILNHQASEDPRKEGFLRGIVLSMFPDARIDAAKQVITDVRDDLERKSGLRDILGGDELTTFLARLDLLLCEVQKIWEYVQSSTERLEHDFDYDPLVAKWQPYELPVKGADSKGPTKRPDKQNKHLTTTSTDGNGKEDYWVVLPPIYIMGVVPRAIHHGTILFENQLREAKQEFDSSPPPKSGTVSESLNRSRANPGRRQSLVKTSPKGHFLALKNTSRD